MKCSKNTVATPNIVIQNVNHQVKHIIKNDMSITTIPINPNIKSIINLFNILVTIMQPQLVF